MSKLFVIAGFLIAATAAAQGNDAQTEVMVKARAIRATTYFTVFPLSTPADRPLVIGFLGDSPLGKALETIMPPGTIMRGRPVQIRNLRTRKEVEAADVLFIPESEKGHIQELMQWLKGRPILTVGDTESFLKNGVMVHLALEKGHVRPWVSLKPAKDAGLSFSSNLLALAKVIETAISLLANDIIFPNLPSSWGAGALLGAFAFISPCRFERNQANGFHGSSEIRML